MPETWTLGPPGLAVGVAPIAFSLADSLVFQHPRDAFSFRCLARFGFGARRGICCRLPLSGLDYAAFGLVAFYPFTFKAPRFPGNGDGHAFRLPRQSGGLGGSPCRAIGIQESGLRLRGRSTAVGKVVVSGVLQIFVLQARCNKSGRLGPLREKRRYSRLPVLQFFRKAGFTKPPGLFLAGQNEGIEFLDSAVAREELRLGIGEGNLRLLAGFAVCL